MILGYLKKYFWLVNEREEKMKKGMFLVAFLLMIISGCASVQQSTYKINGVTYSGFLAEGKKQAVTRELDTPVYTGCWPESYYIHEPSRYYFDFQVKTR